MTDSFDDQIRNALRAEAEGVEAGDELLARVRSEASKPEGSTWRRRAPWLLTAAAATVVVVGAAALVVNQDDGDQTVDVAGDPTTTTEPDVRALLPGESLCDGSSEVVLLVAMAPEAAPEQVGEVHGRLKEAGENEAMAVRSTAYVDQEEAFADLDAPGDVEVEDVPSYFLVNVDGDDLALRAEISDLPGVAATISETCTEAPVGTTTTTTVSADGDADRPALVALVREDGMLMTVDLETGEERDLHTAGDPRDAPDEGGPQFIDGVDLSPDGQWIYFSTCCEPAPGITFRIPIEGGEPEQVGYGAYPSVSPDGRFVAVGAGEYVSILSTEDTNDGLGAALAQAMVEGGVSSVTWSPDGLQLAAVVGRFEGVATGGPGLGEVLLFTWDGATLDPSEIGKPTNPGSFASFRSDGMLSISSGGPVDDDRDRAEDRSAGWILWVDQDGTVLEQAGAESGDRTPIAGLPRALAADW